MSCFIIKIINDNDNNLEENILTIKNNLDKNKQQYISFLKIEFDENYKYCYEHEFDLTPPKYYFISIYTVKDINRIQKKGRKLLFNFINTDYFESSGYSLTILNEIYNYKYTKCNKCSKYLEKNNLQNHIKQDCDSETCYYDIKSFDIDIYYKWFMTTNNIEFFDIDKDWNSKTIYENIVK